MKSIFIGIIVALSCNGQNIVKLDKTRYVEVSFSSWTEDSIKTFLSDKWVRLGRLKDNKIITDTLGSIFSNNTSRKIIVEPSGKYELLDGQKEKQVGIPTIYLDFNNNSTSLFEDDYYPPSFIKGELFTRCLAINDLLIQNNRFYILTLYDTEEIKLEYLNEGMITIKDVVYIRAKKWIGYVTSMKW